MAWTNVGFDGTINEAQWASLAGLLGNDYVAAGNGDCVVTAVPGARSVSVAAGSLYGDGILSTNSAPETVAMTTPVNGQWYVIALRRTWATNTAALVAIAGATTTTTTPTAPPTSFPTLNTNKGVLTDQPIAWAWCNSANTTVVVYDIRLKAVKSLPPVVANANERDAKFMSPSQGLQVWRDDLGAVQTYYGAFNSSTNPGGRDSAGWYVTERSSALVPIKATLATVTSGTGSVSSTGTLNFAGASSIILDGVFSSQFKKYRIIFDCENSTNTGMYMLYRTSGVSNTSGNYWRNYVLSAPSYFQGGAYGTAAGYQSIDTADVANTHWMTMDVHNPFSSADYTKATYNVGAMITSSGAMRAASWTTMFASAVSFDGFIIAASSGTMAGKITVYGYLDA